MGNPYFNQGKENKPVPAINWFIEIDGIRYLEILDCHVENVAPGQYISPEGVIYNTNSKRFIHPSLNVNGYVQISLNLNDRTRYVTGVHRLLMLVYKYEYGCEKLVVNHIDGNKQNNSFDNLEWCTQRENNLHAIETGLTGVGEDASNAVLTNDQVREICEDLAKKRYPGQIAELARKYNVSYSTIDGIARGRYWNTISKDYNINFNFHVNEKILTEEIVRKICEELQSRRYIGQATELAKKYDLPVSTVKNIIYRRNWTDVSKDYVFETTVK